MVERIEKINHILSETYGKPKKEKIDMDPVLFLIHTILSQNTNDKNRDKAYAQLMEKYSSAEEILNAPRDELAQTIYTSGHYNMKAKRIQDILQRIKDERGELTLDFITHTSKQEAMNWLTALPGIGMKSAAVILNFRFDMNTFPVDTHVYRVATRIGLTAEKDRDKAQEDLEEKVPDTLAYPFHMLLIQHGREVCKAPTPHCSRCPLQQYCAYYQQQQESVSQR